MIARHSIVHPPDSGYSEPQSVHIRNIINASYFRRDKRAQDAEKVSFLGSSS